MGYILGMLSSAAFGMIPLFTLPLLFAGISVHTALAYRFLIATVVMWLILLAKKEKIAIDKISLAKIGTLSLMYLLAVVLFFYSFNYLASGVVATIQFLYPVMVMLIMTIFFHEKFSFRTAIAIGFAIAGVMLLSMDPGPEKSNMASSMDTTGGMNIFWGTLLSLLAGLCNALYFVGIQVARLPNINGLVMTFYVMLFGAFFCLANALICDALQWIGNLREFFLALLLAIVTAVFSNLTLIMAIKRIGSTMTSILGVMEPLTAVAIGVLVFGEPFTNQLAIGIILIVCAVVLAVTGKKNAFSE